MQQFQSLHESTLGPLHVCMLAGLVFLEGLLTVGVGLSLTLLPVLGILFLLLGCLK